MIRSLKIFVATVIVVWAWLIVAVSAVLAFGFALISAIQGNGWITVFIVFGGVPALIGLIAIGNTLLDWRRDVRDGWAWGKN